MPSTGSIDALQPLRIIWNPGCITALALSLYSLQLKPCRWDVISLRALQVALVPSTQALWENQYPRSVFTATYSTPSDGMTPAIADVFKMGEEVPVVSSAIAQSRMKDVPRRRTPELSLFRPPPPPNVSHVSASQRTLLFRADPLQTARPSIGSTRLSGRYCTRMFHGVCIPRSHPSLPMLLIPPPLLMTKTMTILFIPQRMATTRRRRNAMSPH
ncbi:hypothetical protein BDQ12DRAFT_452486 [Crucibulum laeve]|uniref:Uncharacterized protein n=1 Tax=Crucibulum laeve TaxID=68775 RepID=A0A5C3LJS6_9AGAR|nr:hypothetical protein BDQ12DRAFT_452486 [Crucibulum laeve]